MVSNPFAAGADSRSSIQFQVDNAPLACRHGIEAKRLRCFTHPLGCNPRRKLQFFQPSGAICTAIESNTVMQPRVQPQPAMRNMLQREKQLGVFIEKQPFVSASKFDRHFGFFGGRARAPGGEESYSMARLISRNRKVEEALQFLNHAVPIQLGFARRIFFPDGPPGGGKSFFVHSFFFLNLGLGLGSGCVRFR